MSSESQTQFENSYYDCQSEEPNVSSILLKEVFGAPDSGTLPSAGDRSSQSSGANSPEIKNNATGIKNGITGEDQVEFLRKSNLLNKNELHSAPIDLDEKTMSKLSSLHDRIQMILRTVKSAPEDLRRAAEEIQKSSNGTPSDRHSVPKARRTGDQSKSSDLPESSLGVEHKANSNNISDVLAQLRSALMNGENPKVQVPQSVLEALVRAQLKHMKGDADSSPDFAGPSKARLAERDNSNGAPKDGHTVPKRIQDLVPKLYPIIDR